MQCIRVLSDMTFGNRTLCGQSSAAETSTELSLNCLRASAMGQTQEHMLDVGRTVAAMPELQGSTCLAACTGRLQAFPDTLAHLSSLTPKRADMALCRASELRKEQQRPCSQDVNWHQKFRTHLQVVQTRTRRCFQQ